MTNPKTDVFASTDEPHFNESDLHHRRGRRTRGFEYHHHPHPCGAGGGDHRNDHVRYLHQPQVEQQSQESRYVHHKREHFQCLVHPQSQKNISVIDISHSSPVGKVEGLVNERKSRHSDFKNIYFFPVF